jgi:hypothetical protein
VGKCLRRPGNFGNQLYNLTATATTMAARTVGALPGGNVYWSKDATGALGYYIELSGSNAHGSIAVSTTSGISSPWPDSRQPDGGPDMAQR